MIFVIGNIAYAVIATAGACYVVSRVLQSIDSDQSREMGKLIGENRSLEKENEYLRLLWHEDFKKTKEAVLEIGFDAGKGRGNETN